MIASHTDAGATTTAACEGSGASSTRQWINFSRDAARAIKAAFFRKPLFSEQGNFFVLARSPPSPFPQRRRRNCRPKTKAPPPDSSSQKEPKIAATSIALCTRQSSSPLLRVNCVENNGSSQPRISGYQDLGKKEYSRRGVEIRSCNVGPRDLRADAAVLAKKGGDRGGKTSAEHVFCVCSNTFSV